MTSTGPFIERPHRLLTHKDYAVEEVQYLIKSTDVDPCAELGAEELGGSALFDLTQVNSFFLVIFISLFFFFPLFLS